MEGFLSWGKLGDTTQGPGPTPCPPQWDEGASRQLGQPKHFLLWLRKRLGQPQTQVTRTVLAGTQAGVCLHEAYRPRDHRTHPVEAPGGGRETQAGPVLCGLRQIHCSAHSSLHKSRIYGNQGSACFSAWPSSQATGPVPPSWGPLCSPACRSLLGVRHQPPASRWPPTSSF